MRSLFVVCCEACWHSFVFHNPDLEGMWEDGELSGEFYVPNAAEDWSKRARIGTRGPGFLSAEHRVTRDRS